MRSKPARQALLQVAANIRGLRIRRGWTQEQFAEAVGVAPRYIQRFETGRANPTVATLADLGGVLGADLAAFFRKTPIPERKRGRPRKLKGRGPGTKLS